jgi:hypothetical protein
LRPDQHFDFEQMAVSSLFDFADRHLLGNEPTHRWKFGGVETYGAKSDSAFGQSAQLEVLASAKDPNPFARSRFSNQSILPYRRATQDPVPCHEVDLP